MFFRCMSPKNETNRSSTKKITLTSLKIFLSPVPLGCSRSAISHKGISSKTFMTSSSKKGNLACQNIVESSHQVSHGGTNNVYAYTHLFPMISYTPIISSQVPFPNSLHVQSHLLIKPKPADNTKSFQRVLDHDYQRQAL